jgi:uroporphyrinogen-III synthase
MSKKSIMGTVFGSALGVAGGAFLVNEKVGKEKKRQKQLADKHLALLIMMCDWMRTKQEGKSLAGYLKEKGYKRVAVYGLSYVGERLLDELRDNGIEVEYAVDQKADPIYFDVEICRPEEDLEEVDAVIVTAITFYDEIKAMLEEKLQCPILSLEDMIQEL